MSGSRLWYGGLPATGMRWLGEEELRELRRRVWRKPDASKPLIVLAVVVGVLFLLSFWIGDLHGFFHTSTYPFGLILALALQRSTANNSTLRTDAEAGFVTICSNGEHTIEVLPGSAMLWSLDGKRVTKWQRVTRSTTTPMPEHAKMAANFVRPVDGATNNVSGRRSSTCRNRSCRGRSAPSRQSGGECAASVRSYAVAVPTLARRSSASPRVRHRSCSCSDTRRGSGKARRRGTVCRSS